MAIYGFMMDNRTVLERKPKEEISALVLDASDIKRILGEHGMPPVADWRLDEVGRDLAKAIAEYGLEPCGVSWFAHMLEHDVYDPNLRRVT